MVIQGMNMFRNAGGSFLYNKTLAHFLSGGKRLDLKLSDADTQLWKRAYHEKG